MRRLPKITLSETKPAVLAYAFTLAAAAVIVAAALVLVAPPDGPVLVILLLGCVAVVAERGSVQMSTKMDLEESISLLPTLFAAVLLGPLAGLVVGAASMLGDFRRPYLRWSVYTSSRAITGAVTGVIAGSASSMASSDLGAVVVATLAGAVAAQILDVAFACFTVWLRGTSRPSETARTIAPVAFAAVPLYAPVVILLTIAYQHLSPWTLVLFFVPALAAQRLFALLQGQRQLTDGLSAANQQLENANLSFASALVATLDARDQYTAGHSAAVAIYARDIASRMGLSPTQQRLAHLAGLVHDIGKIGLPVNLLEKPGALTPYERLQMQEHSTIGERILTKVDDYAEIALIVRHHHERVDGHGYPDGLTANEIPLLARVIAVADAYNAMTSHRAYRDAMPSSVARARLNQAGASQFDPFVLAAFDDLLANADEQYGSATRRDFILSRNFRPIPTPLVDVA